MNPIPHVVSASGPSATAPDGSIPIALYGVDTPVPVPDLPDLGAEADLAAVIDAHNDLLAALRAAGILGDA